MKSRYAPSIASDFAAEIHLALVVADRDGDIRYANKAFCEMFDYDAEEVLGQPITIIVPDRMRGAHNTGLSNLAAGSKPALIGKPVEVSALRRDGSEFPIEMTLAAWTDATDFWAGATIKDISERREREARLMRLASQDTLTGLPNRHDFMTSVSARLASGASCTLILLDLDGFKEINDTHGHIVGDSLLQAVAVRLPPLLGEEAIVARLGGDEFAVLFPNITAPSDAVREASRILAAFRKPFSLGGLELDIGASLGVAIAPTDGSEAEELLASADFALYRARAAGQRGFRLFKPEMRKESQAKRDMRDELRLALRNGELELYFQPQVELATRRTVSFEALIRWNHPERGLLLPGAFLPSLEQSALASDIGWWTLEEACRVAALFNETGREYTVGVNLFPLQFRAPNLQDRVMEALDRYHLPAHCLELEVTEEVALNDDDASLHTLAGIRDIGVGVGFDDFGTGYASLISLQRYPLTTLKIDRGFIRDIETRPWDAAITRALVAMSREMGLRTVAEGIETEAQEAVLLDLGCDIGQGYLYGRPMRVTDAIKHLRGTEEKLRV